MDDWSIQDCGKNVIVTHKDGSGVVVKKEHNDRISADILARLALDFLESKSQEKQG